MSLGQQIKALFKSEEVQSILAADDDDAPKTSTETNQPVTEQPPTDAQPAATTQVPPIEQPATATVEQKLAAAFKETAEVFATSEIKAGRMSPREKDDFIENFAQAAHDDHLSPLASGSRVDRLKTQQTNRKSSRLTEETVNAENNQVLLAQPGVTNADEKKQKLLSRTQLGKRALELKK